MSNVRYVRLPSDHLDLVRIRTVPRAQSYAVEVDEASIDPLLGAEMERESLALLQRFSWRPSPGKIPAAVVRVHRVSALPGGRLVQVDLETPGAVDVLVDRDLMRPDLPRVLGEHATAAARFLRCKIVVPLGGILLLLCHVAIEVDRAILTVAIV